MIVYMTQIVGLCPVIARCSYYKKNISTELTVTHGIQNQCKCVSKLSIHHQLKDWFPQEKTHYFINM